MNKDEVKKYAELAQISLSDEELDLIAQDFEKVIEYFDCIQEVDTDGLAPLFNGLLEPGEFRKDQTQDSPLDELIERAPEVVGRLFKVPPVVG